MPLRAHSEDRPTVPVIHTVAELHARARDFRGEGGRVGLIPTMGALHDGHLELVRQARARCARTITTVFVNPKQFERPDDLDGYPRSVPDDAAVLAAEGCDLLFAPNVNEMYPTDFATNVTIGGVAEPLEGAHRPGHFTGVATVVAKLLLQSLPDEAYFGEKDYQQLQTVRRLVQDLNIPVTIRGVLTVREPDGLALSSRNRQLTPEQRRIAPTLYRVLLQIAEQLAGGTREARPELDAGVAQLHHAGFGKVDYLSLADARDLSPLSRADRPARLLAAAWLGDTRLIDNVPVA